MAARGFVPPKEWSAENWRHDFIPSCGLTKLAVEACLRDAGVVPVPSGSIIGRLGADPGGATRGVIGCSCSGRSAEVLDCLEATRSEGLRTCLAGLDPGRCDLVLSEVRVPRSLQHVVIAATLPRLMGREVIEPLPKPAVGQIVQFLAAAYDAGQTPLFVGAEPDFDMRLLQSYWLEFLRRPAFSARHPEWTHDLLWAIHRSTAPPVAIIFHPPRVDLSDGRARSVVEWLCRQKLPHLLLSEGPREVSRHVERLLAYAEAFADLAMARGLDLDGELQFRPREGHPPS